MNRADQAVLVNLDIEMGQRVIDALDRAGYPPEEARWAMFPQYENWRFVLSSSRIPGYEEPIGHLWAQPGNATQSAKK